jgi:hypothetical protein
VVLAVTVWYIVDNYQPFDALNKSDQEEDSSDLSAADRAKLAAMKKRGIVTRDPYEDRIDELVEVLHTYRVDDFPLFLDHSAIFEFLERQQKRQTRWGDLSMREQLGYPDRMRKDEPFNGRWKLATLGERRRTRADLPGYLDHDWVVVPRTFPSGEVDEVWLLVQKSASQRPRVRGFKQVVVQPPRSARVVTREVDVPKLDGTPGYKKKDPGLKRSPLPATALDGDIDETGQPTAPLKPVPLVKGTSSATTAQIRSWISVLTDPEQTRKARDAQTELLFVGKPAIPILLNSLLDKDLNRPENVFSCHQVIQALRELTGQRFGFEPQVGERILTAASADDQKRALRKWFGWWRVNAETFQPELSPRLQEEKKKREHYRERFRK